MIKRIVNFLKLLYKGWMKFAYVLSWVNTRLILIIMFYLVFTPTGLIMRLFGADSLELKIEKMGESYWKKKEKKPFKAQDYERQF